MRIKLGHKSRYAHTVQETGEMEKREELLSLFSGVRADHYVSVGRIDRELANRIGATTDLVEASPITVLKVKGKHTTVTDYDMELLHHGFLTGRVQTDGPRHLTFLFRDPRDPHRTLKAVVKATRKNELLLSTYHPCTGNQLKRALQKGTVIRDDGTWDQKE